MSAVYQMSCAEEGEEASRQNKKYGEVDASTSIAVCSLMVGLDMFGSHTSREEIVNASNRNERRPPRLQERIFSNENCNSKIHFWLKMIEVVVMHLNSNVWTPMSSKRIIEAVLEIFPFVLVSWKYRLHMYFPYHSVTKFDQEPKILLTIPQVLCLLAFHVTLPSSLLVLWTSSSARIRAHRKSTVIVNPTDDNSGKTLMFQTYA
ncbi:hypothetical protein C4D60_Mb03t05230 [Musa balbisiana]|uniref:Uncharacterized protein n=1 Tax=Musa balbisiana TaxID=52838 RepID=A0A4S8J7S3_MUSBA|nr:hypothetical protein C4D60_Mb03t05230 [Musa balbisiana]